MGEAHAPAEREQLAEVLTEALDTWEECDQALDLLLERELNQAPADPTDDTPTLETLLDSRAWVRAIIVETAERLSGPGAQNWPALALVIGMLT